MTVAKNGDKVAIHYKGTLRDGSVFDSSEGRAPLEFTLGSGQVIAGMDAGILDMAVGDKKTLDIPCAEAYGPINPAMRQEVPRDAIPEDIPLELGLQLQMQTPDGHVLPVTVVELGDENITLDANHSLAGQDLIFEVELVSVAEG